LIRTICFLLFFAIAASPVLAAEGQHAPAGASVKSSSEISYDGGVRTSEAAPVNIPQIFGLRFVPAVMNEKIPYDRPTYIPCSIENLGNGTDRVLIDLNHTTTDYTIRLVIDDNSDGVHQDIETADLPESLVIGEGAAQKFFIEIVPPKNAKKGTWLWATLSAFSSIADGAAYRGYNGLSYGGNDKLTLMISLTVE
jgi:hypothetical protein